jgi:hypothetical protein
VIRYLNIKGAMMNKQSIVITIVTALYNYKERVSADHPDVVKMMKWNIDDLSYSYVVARGLANN